MSFETKYTPQNPGANEFEVCSYFDSYSTVTDFAKLRGLSTSWCRPHAI